MTCFAGFLGGDLSTAHFSMSPSTDVPRFVGFRPGGTPGGVLRGSKHIVTGVAHVFFGGWLCLNYLYLRYFSFDCSLMAHFVCKV